MEVQLRAGHSVSAAQRRDRTAFLEFYISLRAIPHQEIQEQRLCEQVLVLGVLAVVLASSQV
jgi:hypothetical protein